MATETGLRPRSDQSKHPILLLQKWTCDLSGANECSGGTLEDSLDGKTQRVLWALERVAFVLGNSDIKLVETPF